MARLDYADLSDPAAAALTRQILEERGTILHLYQMLLHSPPVAKGWLAYLTAIRQQTGLSGALREMLIVRIAYLNRAPYEAEQHEPIALKEGVSPPQLRALAGSKLSGDVFDAPALAALHYADAMTRDIQVPDAVYESLSAHFGPREIVEITATVAAYNMVSRFLEALQIHSGDPR